MRRPRPICSNSMHLVAAVGKANLCIGIAHTDGSANTMMTKTRQNGTTKTQKSLLTKLSVETG